MKTDFLGTKISPEIKEKLKKQAKKENRTLSSLVCMILENYLKEN